MVSEDRVRALFDTVMAKLETIPRDAKIPSVAWMARLELLVASGALGWVLGGTGDRLRAGLALHGIELPEGNPPEPVPGGRWSANPPTKPGWYRWRCGGWGENEVRVYQLDGVLYFDCRGQCRGVHQGEWWSIPIQQPASVSPTENQ